jgi:SAM-dependent methyltransferase
VLLDLARPGGRLVDQFYEQAGSLFVDAYDAFYSSSGPQIAGDLAFYQRVAREVGGPVLELACGTGRIALPLAGAGLHVTGVDRSEAMLTIARRKLAALPDSMQERLTLVNRSRAAARFFAVTEYNFVMLIISIVMIIFFVVAWLVTEEKRRNNAVNKYATATPQLRNDMINKIIRVGMSEEQVIDS